MSFLRLGTCAAAGLVVVVAACSPAASSGTTAAEPVAEADKLPLVSTSVVVEDTPSSSNAGEPDGDQPLLLGLTPFPSKPTTDAVGTAFELAAANGSLVAHHFDRGIPWEALLTGEPLPGEFAAELTARRSESEGHVVYVATAITNFARDGIPEGLDGASLPARLQGAGPADPEVAEALEAWVDLLVAELDPTYLNVGVELDLAVAKRPDLADEIIGLYRRLYEHAKSSYPDVVVFASFQAELGDPTVVATVADATDLIAVSLYPYFAGSTSSPDSGYLDRFFEPGLAVAIAETGFPAGHALTPSGEISSSPGEQVTYMRWLLDQACTGDMAFVIWFLPTDIDIPAWNYPPDLAAIAEVFAGNGLHATDGTPRAALDLWSTTLATGCPS